MESHSFISTIIWNERNQNCCCWIWWCWKGRTFSFVYIKSDWKWSFSFQSSLTTGYVQGGSGTNFNATIFPNDQSKLKRIGVPTQNPTTSFKDKFLQFFSKNSFTCYFKKITKKFRLNPNAVKSIQWKDLFAAAQTSNEIIKINHLISPIHSF